jgi:hypothetical protein
MTGGCDFGGCDVVEVGGDLRHLTILKTDIY